MLHAAAIPPTYQGNSYLSVSDNTSSPSPRQVSKPLNWKLVVKYAFSLGLPSVRFSPLALSFNPLRDPYKDSLDFLNLKIISFWCPPGPHQNGIWIFFKSLIWSLLFPFLHKSCSCSTTLHNRNHHVSYVLKYALSNPMQDMVLKKMFEQLPQDRTYFQVGRAINGKEQLKTHPPSIYLCSRIGSISEFISPWKPHLIFSFESFLLGLFP